MRQASNEEGETAISGERLGHVRAKQRGGRDLRIEEAMHCGELWMSNLRCKKIDLF